MPDASQIPLETQVPSLQSALAPMSTLLNMRQGVNNLQLQQQAIDSGGMNLQAQTQANQERQNLMQLMQDPNSGVFNSDGSPNLQVAQQKIMQAAPQTGPDVLAKMTALSNNHSVATDARNSMLDADKARVSGMATTLEALNATAPQAKAAFDLLGQQYDDPNVKKFAGATSSTLGMLPPDQPITAMMQKLRGVMMPAGEQQNTYAPKIGYTAPGATPQTAREMNPNRADVLTPQGSSNGVIPAQIGVGEQNTVVPSNVPGAPLVVLQRSPSGNFTGATSAGTLPQGAGGSDLNDLQARRRYLLDQADLPENNNPTTQASIKAKLGQINQLISGATGTQAFEALPPGESAQTRDALTQARQNSNNQAAQAGNIASNNQQILHILSSGTTTGSNAGQVQKVMGAIGLQWTGDEASNLNQLSHYLALQAQSNEKSMGVHTDAGAETAGLASGTIQMTPKALASAVKANDALTTGSQAYNVGLENAIKQGGSIFAARPFQNQWSQNFDPVIFRYANALRDGDTAEKTRIEQQYQKPGPGQKPTPQWSGFVSKMQKLDQLEGGQ